MASVKWDPRGNAKILVYIDGAQRSIGIGGVSDRTASRFAEKLEALVLARKTATADPEALAWAGKLAKQSPAIYDRLAELGLVAPRAPEEVHTLGELIDRWIAGRAIKRSTRTRYGQSKALLVEFFEGETDVATIGAADAAEFRAWLLEAEYSAAKVAREVSVARSIFEEAVHWGWVGRNPFGRVAAGAQRNDARKCYVPRETIAKVLEACPDAEWRCIVALARYAGLRCPSEVLLLRWTDVLWDANRFRVTSPKTEHHAGHGERWVPLFPEVRRELLARFEEARDGAEFVIERYQGKENLSTQLKRIITRAGVKRWPRTFNNLRASCATDLAERFPQKDWSSWMGHSAAISLAHYQTPSDAAFDAAAREALPEALTRTADARQRPTRSAFDGACRPMSDDGGGSSGRNRTRTCDLIHVTDAL